MLLIRPCSACNGPVSLSMARCPHCEKKFPFPMPKRLLTSVMSILGGVSLSSTLAACYGQTCATAECGYGYIPTCDEISEQPEVDDVDNDSYCLAYDCDEDDDSINSAAYDTPGDGIDQDCDGEDAIQ